MRYTNNYSENRQDHLNQNNQVQETGVSRAVVRQCVTQDAEATCFFESVEGLRCRPLSMPLLRAAPPTPPIFPLPHSFPVTESLYQTLRLVKQLGSSRGVAWRGLAWPGVSWQVKQTISRRPARPRPHCSLHQQRGMLSKRGVAWRQGRN